MGSKNTFFSCSQKVQNDVLNCWKLSVNLLRVSNIRIPALLGYHLRPFEVGNANKVAKFSPILAQRNKFFFANGARRAFFADGELNEIQCFYWI